jgi:hypothetical protein
MKKMNAETQTVNPNEPSAHRTNSAWKSLYTIGGVAALVVVLLYLLDIAVSFGGGDTQPGALTAIQWFTLLQANGLLGLRTLGLLNAISVLVAAPLYFALLGAHRRANPVYAGLALIVFLMGAVIYVAHNPAVPMFALSTKFATATTDAERLLLAAAGEALLARGEDFTPGGFIGLFLTEIAGQVMSLVMLGGKIFSRAAAFAGIVGLTLLSLFTIWATFVPVGYPVAMILAVVGGLSIMGWYLLTARRLFQLSA